MKCNLCKKDMGKDKTNFQANVYDNLKKQGAIDLCWTCFEVIALGVIKKFEKAVKNSLEDRLDATVGSELVEERRR